MEERRSDFLSIQKQIGKVTPQELGRLMKEYFGKYQDPVLISAFDANSLFDGDILSLPAVNQ